MIFRERALNSRYTRTEKVQVRFPDEKGVLGEPETVEVRQPSLQERAQLLKAAGAGDDKKADAAALQVDAILMCCFIDGKRCFVPEDRDALLSMPPSGWLDDLFIAAMRLINVERKDAEKN